MSSDVMTMNTVKMVYTMQQLLPWHAVLENPEQFDFFENQKPTSEVISEHLISKHFLGSAGLLHAYAHITPPPPHFSGS